MILSGVDWGVVVPTAGLLWLYWRAERRARKHAQVINRLGRRVQALEMRQGDPGGRDR